MPSSPTNVKLAIFPASGGLGSATLEHLLKSGSANPQDVVLVARSQQGVEVRKADCDEPASLVHAFDGVKILNLISYASIQEEHRFNAHKLSIDAAIASGVSHIVYSSLGFGGLPSSTTPPSTVTQVMAAHVKTEIYLASLHQAHPSSFTYSVLRQGIYSESWELYTAFLSLTTPPASGKVLIPHNGSGPGLSWVKRDELGEATATILLQLHLADGRADKFKNITTLLSGSRDVSLNETVAIIGSAVGRDDLKVVEVSVEEYVAQPQV